MRNATIEMDVREEIAQEMQATIQKMHDDFAQRLQEQVSNALRAQSRTCLTVRSKRAS
jgi:kinesin family protein 20